jgi:hypothetical protein
VIGISDVVQAIGFVAWPLAAVVLIGVILKSHAGSTFLTGAAGRISHVKGPGFELDLEPGHAQKIKVDLETEFSDYRSAIRKRFDALNHQHDVVQLRDRLAQEVLLPARRDDAPLRCTIYVPDIVFADALYRLTDYYPTGDDSGGKVYSIRFGIIGRQWRLGEDRYEPKVTVNVEDLMKDWGMTRAQANSKSTDRSFLVVMLRHDDANQGLLLVSSETECPFQYDSIAESVRDDQRTRALARHVAHVNREMRKRGPSLKLFDE